MTSVVRGFKKLLFSDRCSVCSDILSEREAYICKKCETYLREDGFLKSSGHYFYLYYYDENIRKLMADYKLKNRKKLVSFFREIAEVKIKKIIKEKEIDYVIPIPISKERVRVRGFNQVEEILKICEIPFLKTERIRDTKYMYNLKDESERRDNVADIFKIQGDLKGKNILVVDDILTTGATVFEFIKEIRKNYKVNGIYVFSIAIAQKFLRKG